MCIFDAEYKQFSNVLTLLEVCFRSSASILEPEENICRDRGTCFLNACRAVVPGHLSAGAIFTGRRMASGLIIASRGTVR
jgi:hypothetical protein